MSLQSISVFSGSMNSFSRISSPMAGAEMRPEAGFRTLVIFEQLYAGDKAEGTPIAVHADPEDEGQTIRIPENPYVDTGDSRPVRTAAALTLVSASLLLILLKIRSKNRPGGAASLFNWRKTKNGQ